MGRAQDLAALLRAHRMPQATERQLQDAIAKVLARSAVAFSREHRLSTTERPDFFVAPGVCVEVKVGGPSSEVLRQLARYAEHDVVEELLLVTTRRTHDVMPAEVCGKPLTTVCVGSAFL